MSSVRSIARRPESSVGALVGAFESETQNLIARTAPASEHAILYTLLAMVALALALLSVAKLDRVVVGAGRIVASEGTLYVQPLERAIVREILVKPGETARAGQPLAILDPTFAAADLAQLEQRVASAEAATARLAAEQAGEPYRPQGAGADERLQAAIHEQRLAERRSALADFDARVLNGQATVNRLQRDAAMFRERLKIAADLEQMNVKLEQQGWNSRLKTLLSTDNRMEVERMLTQTTNQIEEHQHLVDATRAQREVFIERWRSEVAKDLVVSRNDLDRLREESKKARRVRELVNLTAPADAIVLEIGRASVGSIVGAGSDAAGDPLFTLVRLDAPLEAEIEIDARDIGFLRPGDPVDVKLDAYRFLEHGAARGVVQTISEGSFTMSGLHTPRSPFFKATVALTDVRLRNVPESFRLIPGMTVTGDVVVGRRSIMSYLVEGALKTGSEAMREP